MSTLAPQLSAPRLPRPSGVSRPSGVPRPSARQRPVARRLAPVAAVALAAVGVVHLLDGPGSLQDQFYVGALELALAAACLPLAVLLIVRPVGAMWSTALGLNLAALLVYAASRTVGLPGSMDDIGNWTQALGLVNVVAEVGVIAVATAALGRAGEPRRLAAAGAVGRPGARR